jgi:hypothetical protein
MVMDAVRSADVTWGRIWMHAYYRDRAVKVVNQRFNRIISVATGCF